MSKRKSTNKKKSKGSGDGAPAAELDMDIGAVWEAPPQRILKDPPAATLAIREKGPHYAVEPDACMENIPVAETGVSSAKPTTVCAVFKTAAERGGDTDALRWEEQDGPDGTYTWHSLSWRAYYDECHKAARSLVHLGLKQFESVNIIGFNSRQWFIGNVAAILAGGKAAGIYTTNQTDACQYIAEHSSAKVVIVENQMQLEKFLPLRETLKNLSALVMWNGEVPAGVNDGKSSVKAYSWAEFMALSDNVEASEVDARMAAQKPGHCCTLIYTSGTTGNPKAVMMSHDNLTFTCKVVYEVMGEDFGVEEEHVVSYLPLSHVAAQMIDIHVPMSVVAVRGGRMTVHFARPDALKGSLKSTLGAARPTVFFGVPRVWEKFADAIKAIGASNGFLKKKIGAWAKGKNLIAYENDQYGGSGAKPFGYGTASKLMKKVAAALGLDRCKVALTGAAPIQQETLRYFGSLGIRVLELYGMSESTGPHTVSSNEYYKIGSCGPVMPGVELRLDHDAERDREGEGEICFRGRHVMMGYMLNEDKTKESIDGDGWLHSGDVGRVDSDGFLYITGRIKELIITAGGENIAPVPMEDAVKETCPAISNVVMVGDKRKYNVCLVTLKCKEQDDGTFTNELVGPALEVNPEVKTVDEARDDPVWQAYIQKGLDYANKEVAVSNASKIQKFAILDGDLSVARGDLTATLKLKRPVLMRREDVIAAVDALYGGAAAEGEKKTKKKKDTSAAAVDAPAAGTEEKEGEKEEKPRTSTGGSGSKKKRKSTKKAEDE